ncbi:MAG: cation transporter [Gemmatimonadota bacterium]
MTIVEGAPDTSARDALVRRGIRLGYVTVAYNCLEAVIALSAGILAGSVALVGFGADSLIEVTAGGAALWRLGTDQDVHRRARAEHIAIRVVGWCFIALAVYVAGDSVTALVGHEPPRESTIGIVLAVVSLIVMPLLATAKRRIALAMNSGALVAEAKQTMICTYLSAILLAGLGLNAVLGWWWTDPVAGLAMVPLIGIEGWEGIRGRSTCTDCC